MGRRLGGVWGPGRLVRLVVQTQVISGGRSHSPFPCTREGDTSQAGTYITFTKGIDALHFLAEGAGQCWLAFSRLQLKMTLLPEWGWHISVPFRVRVLTRV